MNVLNFGSLNIDYAYEVNHLVRPGETENSEELKIVCGGKGLNQSIALARCGANVYHAGNVGMNDGAILLERLSSQGIDVSYIQKHENPSGHAIIQVDRIGQNCILLYGGANHLVTEKQVDEVLTKFDSKDIIVLQNEINLLDHIINKAYERGIQVVLNPSPINKNIFHLPLDKVAYLFINEIEASALLGKELGDNALYELSQKYPQCTIVLTKGEKGVEVVKQGKIYCHGVYNVDVVDTTAAGDTFTGFFLALWIKGNKMEKCLELASKAAAICVSRKGASDSIPSLKEVVESNISLK